MKPAALKPTTFKTLALTLLSMAMVALTASAGLADEPPPTWAYPSNPPNAPRSPDDGTIRHVAGSAAGYTLTQLRDLFLTADWHPEDHRKMPDIVAKGRRPDVFACGVCHRADGSGGPESSSLSGLTAEYIAQQTLQFRSGSRNGSLPRAAEEAMIEVARRVTDQELMQAAFYFAAARPRAVVTVTETDTVPRTEVKDFVLTPIPGGGREAIGQRIIEVPEDFEAYLSRDSHARFIAYVPEGSIARGQALIANGGPSLACATCHGQDLHGNELGPKLTGRSPTYLFRQLYDFKTGARHGGQSPLMKATVANLSIADMIALSAYAASLQP